jgi:hypothetical protein
VPQASEPWTSRDYTQVLFAVYNGQITLPRLGNPKTAVVFAKLIDRGNVDQLMASPLTTALKRDQILIILATTGELRGRYGYSVSLGDDVQSELVQIQAFRLYLIGRLALLDAADGQAVCRIGHSCGNAIFTAMSGTLDTLAERKVFTAEQRLMLIQDLNEQYPMIRVKLSKAEHLETTTRIATIVADEREPRVKSALAIVLEAAIRDN